MFYKNDWRMSKLFSTHLTLHPCKKRHLEHFPQDLFSIKNLRNVQVGQRGRRFLNYTFHRRHCIEKLKASSHLKRNSCDRTMIKTRICFDLSSANANFVKN